MSYNLTIKQKDVVKWLVQQVHEGYLSEEFSVFWEVGGSSIAGFKGEEHPDITMGVLDALEAAGMLLCTSDYGNPIHGLQTEMGRNCVLTGKAYEAVDNNFEPALLEGGTQVTVGAIIHTMSGGNVQAVGIADDAEISQVVNDPELLHSQVEALTENLLNEVKSALKVDELAEYAQAVQELKEQILEEQPDPTLIQRLARTVGLLGDIDGTIGLMTRVWTFLHPLLLIAAARLG